MALCIDSNFQVKECRLWIIHEALATILWRQSLICCVYEFTINPQVVSHCYSISVLDMMC